jgi:WD40 repeat protein
VFRRILRCLGLLLLAGAQVACLALAAYGKGASGPPDRKAVRADRHGDPLPPGAIARLGTLRFGHRAVKWSVAFAPDGKTLLAGGASVPEGDGGFGVGGGFGGGFGAGGGFRGFQGRGGFMGGGFMGFQGAMPRPAAPPAWVKAGKGTPLLFFEGTSGRLVRSIPITRDGVSALALSPDGKVLAAKLTTGPVQLRDAATGKLVRQFGEVFEEQGRELVASLAFSPDGKRLAVVGAHSRALLWEVNPGKVLCLVGPPEWKGHLAFSPDGTAIAGGDEQSVSLWDARTGKQRWRLPLSRSRNLAISFSPDGSSLAVPAENGTLRLIAVASGKARRQWESSSDQGVAVAFSPDGKLLASGGDGGTIRFWDPGTGKELRRMVDCGVPVSSLVFARDGKVLAAGTDWGLRLWDVTTGKELFPGTEHRAPVTGLAFSPDGRALASSDKSGKTLLWEVHTGKPLRRLGQRDERAALAFSRDGKVLVTAGRDGTLLLREAATGKEIFSLRGHTEEVYAAAFAPDGKTLVSVSSDNSMRLWDIETGKELRRDKAAPKRDWVASFAFLPGGRVLVAGCEGKRGYFCEAFTDEPVRWLEEKEDTSAIAFAPGGRSLLAGGADGTVRVWDVNSGMQDRQFEEHEGRINALAITPDGRTAVSVSNGGTIRLWEVASGRQVLSFHGHCDRVLSVAVSPDGRVIATGSRDFTVLLWDATGLGGQGRRHAPLSPEDLDGLWDALAGNDAAAAHRAAWRLAGAPREAVPFLKRHLGPVPAASAARLRSLVADLGDKRLRVRQRASEELERVGSVAVPALRQALAAKPGLEMRRRVEGLLEGSRGPVPSPRRLREVRAVVVLERCGDAGARELLRSLAAGLPGARLTQEAKAALARLRP